MEETEWKTQENGSGYFNKVGVAKKQRQGEADLCKVAALGFGADGDSDILRPEATIMIN